MHVVHEPLIILRVVWLKLVSFHLLIIGVDTNPSSLSLHSGTRPLRLSLASPFAPVLPVGVSRPDRGISDSRRIDLAIHV